MTDNTERAKARKEQKEKALLPLVTEGFKKRIEELKQSEAELNQIKAIPPVIQEILEAALTQVFKYSGEILLDLEDTDNSDGTGKYLRNKLLEVRRKRAKVNIAFNILRLYHE